jgi:hypothetical protein
MEETHSIGERRQKFEQEPVGGQAFKALFEASLTWLRANQAGVNALNVFPVPDGDTGTNMLLTMQSAWDEIADLPEDHLGAMLNKLAHGALMGARGNSGVILSQLWRGFARGLEHDAVLNTPGLRLAFEEARDTAYRGVVRPVEGTILTVSKDMATAADLAAENNVDPYAMLEQVVAAADASVQRTPDLLPVLKEAGVVDSGGMGLLIVFEGMLRYLNHLALDTPELAVQPLSAMNLEDALQEVEEGQDYEVIVDFQPDGDLDLPSFYDALEAMGTSIQIGEGDGLFRVHIHVPTENRYTPIDYAMKLGTITTVRIENLIAQMDELGASRGDLQLSTAQPDEIAVVAVSPGRGIDRVFAGLGVHALIQGGQTMNPSTQEILAAFENLPSDRVIILPNNKNIQMAAESAAELTVKQVAVIPCRTIPQGLAAMLSYQPTGEFQTVVSGMKAALNDVETGEITVATRTVDIDGVECSAGQSIALHNGKLVLSADSVDDALTDFLSHIEIEGFEILTMFFGADAKKSEAIAMADTIRSRHPALEVEVQEGGQPHYHYILSIE